MKRFVKKTYAIALIMSLSVSSLAVSQKVYAEEYEMSQEEIQHFYMMSQQEPQPFIAMDEEGNVEIIPLEDVETPDMEAIELLEEKEYNVVAEIDGTEVILNTKDTEEQAEEVVSEVEEIGESLKTIEDATANETEEIVEKIETLELQGVDELVEQVKEHAETKQDSETEKQEPVTVGVIDRILEPFMPLTVMAAPMEDSGVAQIDNVTVTEITKDVSNGIVIIPGYIQFKHAVTGATGYTHGSYGSDAAYLGMVGDKVKFMQAGVVGLVDANNVKVVNYDQFIQENPVINRYKTTNGRLYHEITTNNKNVASTQMVGYTPEYMENDARYYSYDGIYFYKDYQTMVNDYKAGNYNNAINNTKPYYNYYQYLSHRTQTKFTAEQINQYIESKGYGSKSLLQNTGAIFVEQQNKWGVNAVLSLGISINESAWGTSRIAYDKNNIFGHGAVDSNAYFNAYTYDTIPDSIQYHMEDFISQNYSNPKDWRYYGPHLGNKESGVNKYYAADPYWGEKAASHGYLMEDYFSEKTYDYNTYRIGMVQGKGIACDKPNGKEIYNTITGNNTIAKNIPVVILDEIIENGETWYKIQSDGHILNGNTIDESSGEYSYTDDVVYMKASGITVIGGDNINPGVVKGDVSGDGKITSLDYVKVMNHIMRTKLISDDRLAMADTSGDGKVTSLDYVQIMNHIMGKKLIV